MAISFKSLGATAAKSQRIVQINSTQSWTVPADVTQIELLMCGGGAGGNFWYGNGEQYIYGGPGSVDYWPALSVTAGNAYTVTIGAGGNTSLQSSPGAANIGGTSSFGSLATVDGARSVGFWSKGYSTDSPLNGTVGGRGGFPYGARYLSTSYGYYFGTDGIMGYGGPGGSGHANSGTAPVAGTSGGGRSGFVYYANNSAWVAVHATNGMANTGGGGGGGAGDNYGVQVNAGNGGSGVAIIKYWSAL